MEKKTASAIMLTLLLTSMLTLAFSVQPVKASGTIYIRADGSMDPPTAAISTVDNITYTFTDNIYDAIVVERDNIVVDGKGYTLQGTGGGNGIDLTVRSNVTIKNTQIKKFFYGIWLYSSSYNNIVGNNITNNAHPGISLYSSSGNSISGNNITANNACCIWLEYSSGNSISGNNITNNAGGIGCRFCSDNSISGNNITNSWDGISFNFCSDNSISGNNITANPAVGIVLAFSSFDNSVSGNNIANNREGIMLSFSSDNNIISGNNITNNYCGIELVSSSGNSIVGNNMTDNIEHGIYLRESSNNKFYHNNFIDNTQQVYLDDSGYANVWDDGYPSGGNYWSNYSPRVDFFSGPYQNITGSDGIGDTPYVIDADNHDHYPLMNPYGAPPPPTYALTITTTVGGTTDPAPGTYSYTANSQVQVTAFLNTGYLFDHWELDSVNVGSANPYPVLMDKNHTLRAMFTYVSPPLVVSIFVSALIEGVRFNATSKAVYRFRILQGAVESCPPEAHPDRPEWWGWRTEVLIYRNRPIEWGGGTYAPEHPNPRNWDFSVGDTEFRPTYGEAEEIGKGMFVDVPLEENDYVILVVNDAKGYFWDNSGGINFSISLVPLSASISPLSSTISVGQSVPFSSTVTGGTPPYSYQWYVNGNPVSGATSSSWTFTPTTTGTYYAHLKVTDASSSTAQSETAKTTVVSETSVKVQGKDYPVIIASNTTIEQIVTSPNTLHFMSSGPSGDEGYINVIFPMVNTTEIKVFIDGKKLTPPPFPVITTNGTHYFIYFEFTLSTHDIAIQFAPSEVPVGGLWVPIDKLQLLVPWITSTALMAILTTSFVYIRRKRRQS